MYTYNKHYYPVQGKKGRKQISWGCLVSGKDNSAVQKRLFIWITEVEANQLGREVDLYINFAIFEVST